jgi:uncharacterized membrane protein YeaQ/YmgE (transglycosylase-associated protein family)
MIVLFRGFPNKMSSGEGRVLLSVLVVAIFGAAVCLFVVTQLGGGTEILRPLSNYDIWAIIAGGIGAACGLYLGRDWFGHENWQGWVKMAIGTVIVTFMASVVGGTFALPLYGTMFGPLSVAMTLFGSPLLLIIWVATLVIAHLQTRKWRIERDSIFHAQSK